MKRFLLVLLLLLLWSTAAYSQDVIYESIQAQLEALDLVPLLDFSNQIEREFQEYLPSLRLQDLVGGSSSGRTASELFNLLLGIFFRELRLSLYLLRQLVVVGVLAALLQRLGSSFGEKTIVDLAFGVCFLVLVMVGLQSFQAAASIATGTIQAMVDLMQALLPILTTLLLTVGGITSAAVFHPLLWGMLGSIASLVKYLLLPLILASTAFSLVAHFNPGLPFTKFGGLLKQGVVTLLGLFFLVFSGFMVVRGAIAPVTDGISLRTAKYLTKTFIPVAGGMFADAMEVVVGGSLLIKNGVGVFGLAMVLFIVATPLLKVWAMVILYKVIGVILEPLCDTRLVQALASLETALILVFVCLGTVTLMFLLCITILVGIGNLAVFMR